jgi:hypothetical protein
MLLVPDMLPTVFPVRLPILTRPATTWIALKGEFAAEPVAAPVMEMAVMVLPCTLVAVVTPMFR